MSSPTIDFSKYEQKAPAQIDFSKYEANAAPKASFWDRFYDKPTAEDETLGRELSSAAQSIYGIPKAIIHAFTDEPTAEEKTQFQGDVQGAKRIGLGIHRLTTAPLQTAAEWYGNVAQGRVPDAYGQALSVAPEAIGQGAGTVVSAKLAEMAPASAKAVSDTVQKITPPAIRGAASGINTVLQKAPGAVGAAAGAGAGALTHVPYAEWLGAALGREVGKAVLPKLRVPGEDFGLPTPEPTNPGAPLPATPAPEQLNPSLVSPARTLPGQVAPERIAPEQPIPGVTSRPFIERVQPDRGLLLTGESPETSLNRIRELPTPERGLDPGIRPSIERIIDEAIPANEQPVANFQAKAKANYHLSALEEQLNNALGGKKLAPGVPLKDQAGAMQAPAAKLPEGFTPVESSALNGYKYDPGAQTFESITKNGEHYVHGEVDPETAQEFVDAESKGAAWNKLRNAPGVTYLGKMRNGKLLAAQPPSALRTSMRVEEPPEGTTVPTESNQLGLLEKMLEEALSKRGR
jgi:hypothetical protein